MCKQSRWEGQSWDGNLLVQLNRVLLNRFSMALHQVYGARWPGSGEIKQVLRVRIPSKFQNHELILEFGKRTLCVLRTGIQGKTIYFPMKQLDVEVSTPASDSKACD